MAPSSETAPAGASAAAEDELPVSAEEAIALFAPLARHSRIALAVSGGSDSTALLWLVAGWRQGGPGAPLAPVLSVDHGLRPGSADEAEKVVALAASLGVPAVSLTWEGAKPSTGLQDAAREARYALMTQWCRGHDVPALLTAHTSDDQAETFLMRLARGSGLDGLAGIGDTRRGETEILRPLLDLSRARLRATLEAAGVNWIEDPSNSDERFERVRWRKVLRVLQSEGIEPAAIGLSAGRLACARKALEAALDQLAAAAVVFTGEERAEVAAPLYDAAPQELRIRLLKRLIERIGEGTVELRALERLEAALATKGAARTLAGCRVARSQGRLEIAREGPRGRPKAAAEPSG